MFDVLSLLPSDPILHLIDTFKKDQRPEKVDLGVGVYKDSTGHTPLLESVVQAEKYVIDTQVSKAYIGPLGSKGFNELIVELALGASHVAVKDARLAVMQTPGGCGALRVGAELVKRASKHSTIWVSDPTWANHIPLLSEAGIAINTYPYYDMATASLTFDAMLTQLEQAQPHDLVLLHGACHNPSGEDLTLDQWQQLTEFFLRKNLVPFIDMAYQGFGEGLNEDAAGLRRMMSQVPEAMLALSCSKNFGMYRERVGAIAVLTECSRQVPILTSHMANVVRGIYSMPPAHGALVLEAVLSDHDLKGLWQTELDAMRRRIVDIRKQWVNEMGIQNDIGFIARQKGMFSFLGVSPRQVQALTDEYGIYMPDNSRVCLSGLTPSNIAYVCDALKKIM